MKASSQIVEIAAALVLTMAVITTAVTLVYGTALITLILTK